MSVLPPIVKLFLLVFFRGAHFHFAVQDTNGMLWKIILPWDPNIPQYRLFQPCELSLCIFVSLEGTTPHPSVTYHKNRTWKLSFDSLWFQTAPLPELTQYLVFGFGPVYFVGGGAYESGDAGGAACSGGGGWRWRGGGGGYGAKWKHVIQEPLKRNLARQKKGTHIIIKSSQGKRETANIIPAPPRRHTLRTISHTLVFIFPSDDREDGKIGAVFAQCPGVTRWSPGISWSQNGLYVFVKKGCSYSCPAGVLFLTARFSAVDFSQRAVPSLDKICHTAPWIALKN